MAQGKVEGSLSGKSQGPQVGAFWKDITKFNMFVFQGTFLSGLHGVTVEYPCPPGAVSGRFHCVSGRELRSPVSEQDVDIFPEERRSQDGFEKVDAVFHGQGGFGFLINGEKEAGI